MGVTNKVDRAEYRRQLRARALETRLEGFRDQEIVEYLLAFAQPRADIQDLARRLLDHFGSLDMLFDASADEIMDVRDVNENAATLLSMLVHVFQYYLQSGYEKRPRFTKRDELARYCITMFGKQRVEQLVLVCLDRQYQVIASCVLSTGSSKQSYLYTQEIMRFVTLHHAPTVVLAHNHPSGSLIPSADDISLTKTLEEELQRWKVNLLEHFIIAGDKYSLMSEMLPQRRRILSVRDDGAIPLTRAADPDPDDFYPPSGEPDW